MKISIKQPVALHEIGGKEVNEDFIFPLQGQANIEEKLFIISDGEGGANIGDVASKLVALSFAKFFASTPPKSDIDQSYLAKALSTAEQALSAYKEAHPESVEMATTLAMLHFGENQVTIAWIGNSYVFHYNSVKAKLTAYTGEKGTLIHGAEKPAEIQFHTIPVTDLNPSDYFFISSDGVLEQVDNNTLETIFDNDLNPEPKVLLDEINNLSQSFTQDNYSCYLIEIEKIGDQVTQAAAGMGPDGANIDNQADIDDSDDEVIGDPNSAFMKNLVFGGLILIILCLIFFAWWTTSRPNLYEDLMVRGDENLNSKRYELAISQFDSAIVATTNDTEKTIATKRKGEAIAIRDLSLNDEEPLESLTETAEVYNEEGNEFFKLGNYEDAVKAYRRAERVKERDGAKLPDIPQDKVVTAYLHLGDKLFEGENQNCSQANNLYEKAFAMLESPEISASDETQLKRARERFDQCTDIIAKAKLTEEAQPIAQNNAEEDKKTTTPVTNTKEEDSDANKKLTNPITTPPTKSRDIPTNTKTDNNTATQPSATRRTSGITNTNISSEKAAELAKNLATGKRLFVKARESNSKFEFIKSVENLENSMPNIDGSGAYMLSFMYHSGLGVSKDEAKALKYAQISALRGWATGEYYYGHLLLLRKNSRDTLTAKQSLTKAADQNYLNAINLLEKIN